MLALHGFPMSPNTRRVRLALEEVGAPYEFVAVDLMTGAHRTDAYKELNPTMRVPVLVDGDYRLWESNACLHYLAERFPEKGLLPEGARGRGLVSQWVFMNAAHLSPAVAHVFAHSIRLPEEQRIPKMVENGRIEIDRCLGPLDARLSTREFVVDKFGVADLSIAPTLGYAPMLGIDLSRFPHVAAWMARVQARESWQRIYG